MIQCIGIRLKQIIFDNRRQIGAQKQSTSSLVSWRHRSCFIDPRGCIEHLKLCKDCSFIVLLLSLYNNVSSRWSSLFSLIQRSNYEYLSSAITNMWYVIYKWHSIWVSLKILVYYDYLFIIILNIYAFIYKMCNVTFQSSTCFVWQAVCQFHNCRNCWLIKSGWIMYNSRSTN